MAKVYYTILMDFYDNKGDKICTMRSWTKKIYDNKTQAIDALTQMRNAYKMSSIRYRLVELRITNDLDC